MFLRLVGADGGNEAAIRGRAGAHCRGVFTDRRVMALRQPVKGKNKIDPIGLPLPDVDVRIVVDTEDGERDIRRLERSAN